MQAQDDIGLDESYQLIRRRFIHKLQGWLPVFIAFELSVQAGKTENIENIRMEVHKLAGSARTFGFAKLNGYAADVEYILDGLMDGQKLKEVEEDLKENLSIFIQEVQSIVLNEEEKAMAAPPKKKKPATSKKKTPKKQHEHTILVADDDELVRELLKHGFSKMRCNIVPIDNGKKVLEYLRDAQHNTAVKRPSVIVLDVNMPEMSGFEVLKTIKDLPDLKTIPVIMLTRRDEDESLIKGISSGALDYITKPFAVVELVDRIMRILRRYKTKVLVADDDPLICDLLQQRFSRMGFTVLVARNGNEALTSINQDKPNIVVLDVMMPGTDGFAVLSQVKGNPKTAETPVVMLTAKTQQENVLQGLKIGAHDYITKPFDIDEVAARVTGILQRRDLA